MGLVAHPNRLAGGGKKGAAQKPEVIEVFDVPESDTPSKRQRFPLHREEEAYMVRCMTKHGDNYEAMFRDVKTNAMQHSQEKLRKWGARYLLLTPEQRRLPVPDKLKALLPDDYESA
jgi:nucleolar protein 16